MKNSGVTTLSLTQSRMIQMVKLPRTLLGGTTAMRSAGAEYLPKEPKESEDAWKNRLGRTVLYNAFGRAVTALTGKIFSKPITLKEDVPEPIKEILEDVDGKNGTGRDFNRFLSHVCIDALATGLTHILVDMGALPKDEQGNELQLTVEQAKAQNLQPKWLHYKLESVVSWRHDAAGKLSRLVLKECINEADGEWGEKEIEQYRVLYPGRWEIYRQAETANQLERTWVVFDEGTTALDFIPFVTIYAAKQTAPFTIDKPLLEDLAHLNVAHWQSSSDQRHILHVARVPILFATGWEQECQSGAEQEIGPNRCISQPVGATLTYIEHTGSAIKSGEEDIKKLEDQMAAMAMEPLVSKSGNVTATAKAIDTAEANYSLQDIAQGLKDTIEVLLVCTGAWLGIAPEQCGEVSVNSDFSFNPDDVAALQELTKARQFGDLSREAYLGELKRRDKLAADFDIKADKELIDSEGQPLAVMGGNTNDNTQMA